MGKELTPARAALMGRLGAHSRWAVESDRIAATAPARAAADERFRRQVLDTAAEHGEELTERQIADRAEQLRLAHLARMRLARWDRRQKR